MNSRERVATALRCDQPDRVPYCEIAIDRALAERIMGWGTPDQAASLETTPYTAEEAIAVADELGFDNLSYVLRAPVYAERHAGADGRLFYGQGQIRSFADLHKFRLPDPYDESLYEGAAAFAQQKGERSAWFVTRIGIFPTMLSMGIETFSLALYDNPHLVEILLDAYCEWAAVVADTVCELGFDVYVSTDDMAFNTQPFFSRKVLHELVIPRFREVAANISLPWIIHSDGNIMPFLPDFVELGISGVHPLEKGAMDVAAVKREFGDRICLLGNVDLNILGLGTEEDTEREVYELIQTAGPGGGYIVSSGNSLAGYLKPENVRALSAAVQKYGRYPLQKVPEMGA
jgi:uroporphyrinogen decarboxylase